MKITKRQLKRIIREEKRRLIKEQDVIPPREEHVDTYYDDDAYGRGDELDELPSRAPGEVLQAVKDAIVELFVMNGEVVTSEIFDHLRMNGFNDGDIDRGIDALGDQY